jgi:hypothetical protein
VAFDVNQERSGAMTLPNFLIIGAARSGTTALHRYLHQHPQIYMSPVKEPNFFAVVGSETGVAPPKEGMARRLTRRPLTVVRISDLDSYRALFQPVIDEVAIGEASPHYLITPGTPERIRHYVPDAKLIAILRNPVDRAYSAHSVRWLYGGQDRARFGQTIRDIYWGFYYTHLRRYFSIFGRAQIKIHLYEDFRADPAGVLQDIFQFLGVRDTFVPDLSVRYNVGGMPKNRLWHAFYLGLGPAISVFKPVVPAAVRLGASELLNRLQRRAFTKPPPLEPVARAELMGIYREDILKLQDLLQRDLSPWLKEQPAEMVP